MLPSLPFLFFSKTKGKGELTIRGNGGRGHAKRVIAVPEVVMLPMLNCICTARNKSALNVIVLFIYMHVPIITFDMIPIPRPLN